MNITVLKIVRLRFALKDLVPARVDVIYISLGTFAISALMDGMVNIVIKLVLKIACKNSVTK